MYLIVGLGNPGKEYEKTRHNMGYDCIDVLAKKLDIKVDKAGFKSIYGSGFCKNEKIVLLKPLTFMNLSGEAVRAIVDFYKVDISEKLVVIYDDTDLDEGKIRIRKKGSAGSHNGMKSIVAHLGTGEFPRIRIGLGKCPERMDMVSFVLGRVPADERALADEGIEHAACAVLDMIDNGLDHAMNRYNRNEASESDD